MTALRAGIAVASAVSLLAALNPLGSATAAEPDPLARYTGQQLSWTDCTFKPEVPTQCALMTVPRDWAAPDAGKDLKVYVSKVAATGDKGLYQGVLLTNPGGPGGQGTSMAPSIAKLQPSVNAQYDVLGMDPRGTGQTGAPGQAGLGITCQVPVGRLPEGPLDARDRSRKSISDHQQIPRVVAEACQSQADAPYITTWQTAHDMELLRQLSKAPKLNYVGYSYGSWLGAKYASLFPASTGRFVLDSSVDWQGRLQADFEDFPRMGQRQTEKLFLPWLNRMQPDVFGDTVAEAQKVIEQGRGKATALGLDPDSYDSLFAGNGSQLSWLLVMLSLTVIINGDEAGAQKLAKLPAAVRAQLDTVSRQRFGVPATKLTTAVLVKGNLGQETPDYEQLPITRFAVACGDQPTKSTQWYKRLSDWQGPKYPLFGWQYGLGEVCGPWSDTPRQTLPDLPKSVRDNVLVVQGEFDPQTSYEQAMAAVRKAPGVDVLRVDDSPFHGQYSSQGNPCVDGVVNTYLLHGSKTDNSICPSVPLLGEKQVYPVHGPVDRYADSRHAVRMPSPENSLLRALLADQISRVNSLLH
ncbi:TAP domain protein [Kribbella flavida DSM 17836]|uniref:TAP domain protein n=1 Tax=Kribbella flavida (strain DSM 17836 / JCM 10339 / NBRC 14399) TaxID=479435 RepID=D2Q498_KRIFD|nr:alpha/beta fold hydrolase [Kribbella flavida]ADB30412.1 TAP domain protein [Kribbella flavida DSM 17836]